MPLDFDKIRKVQNQLGLDKDARLSNPSKSTRINNIYTKEKALKPTQKVDPDRIGIEEFIPIVGDILDFTKIGEDINDKNYGQAALGLGLLAIPKPIRSILKFGRKSLIKARLVKTLGNHNNLNKNLGTIIGKGTESTVYEDPNNINKVLKVSHAYGDKQKDLAETTLKILEANKVPYFEKIKLKGTVRNADGTKSPVFSQNKLKTDGVNITELEKDISNKLINSGFSPIFGGKRFEKGDLYIGSMGLGLDNRGSTKIFDVVTRKTNKK